MTARWTAMPPHKTHHRQATLPPNTRVDSECLIHPTQHERWRVVLIPSGTDPFPLILTACPEIPPILTPPGGHSAILSQITGYTTSLVTPQVRPFTTCHVLRGTILKQGGSHMTFSHPGDVVPADPSENELVFRHRDPGYSFARTRTVGGMTTTSQRSPEMIFFLVMPLAKTHNPPGWLLRLAPGRFGTVY